MIKKCGTLLALAAMLAGLLLTAGCKASEETPDTTKGTLPATEATEPTVETTEPSTQATEPTVETTEPSTEATEPTVETTSPQDEAASSLNSFRQSMIGTPELFAAAYLGTTTDMNEVETDMAQWLVVHSPGLSADLPFLAAIDDAHIIGERFGEVYCIVPTDEMASVAVNRATQDENGNLTYETVIYRSESGEPILLFCNNGGFEPDVQVHITDNSGKMATWYPCMKENGILSDAVDETQTSVRRDFTHYAEQMILQHSKMKDTGWSLPTVEQLEGTAWQWEGYAEDGRYLYYWFQFDDGTLQVNWNDGFDEENHYYPDAAWELSYDEGAALLEIDFREFAGVLRYNLLLNEECDTLYTFADFTTGEVYFDGLALRRVLSRSYG